MPSVAIVALLALACTGDTEKTDTTDGTDSGTPIVDMDEDGVAADDDCDDNDASLGAIADDADCDGLVAADDCDDNDAESNAVADDGDCDGTLTADDCDDADATLNADDIDTDGFSSCDGDCDDAVKAVNPDAIEIPGNGTDENCDDVDTGDIVLNELQYDPASGDPDFPGDGGDANFDGVRSPVDDEFVELVNAGTFAVDISGFALYDFDDFNDKKGPKHVVDKGTILEPGKALVVFGGGSPGVDTREFLADGTTPNPDFNKTTNDFGGSFVQTCNSAKDGLNINNGGDSFIMQDAFENTVVNLDIKTLPNYDSGADQAYTRSPDVTGPFDLHTNVVKDVLFSPGTQSDGTEF